MTKNPDPVPAASLEHKHEWLRPLGREFIRAMRKPVEKKLDRSSREWQILAANAMDFLIDVTHGAHLWSGYERWNQRLFGHPLPISEGDPGEGLSPARAAHFIWRMLAILEDGLFLSPTHPDVKTLTDTFLNFWEKRKSSFKVKERYTAFVGGPNRTGWEVKGKLIDLGETSYLFRTPLMAYVQNNFDEEDDRDEAIINIVDDFLCNETTRWSGIGVVDLLAEVLDVPEERRQDILSWKERYVSAYRIEEVRKDFVTAVNVLGGKQYQVVVDNGDYGEFQRGTILFGALIPWEDSWRWSGAPAVLSEPTAKPFDLEKLRSSLENDLGQVVSRTWPEYREKVMKLAETSFERRRAFSGGEEFVVYETTQKLAGDLDRFETAYPDDRFFWLNDNNPDLDGEAAVLHLPDGSSEIFHGYSSLKSALEKKGEGLTEVEKFALLSFVHSSLVSPEFVKRVLEDNPGESVCAEFGLPAKPPAYWLEWLLRCFKGGYYRTRYPALKPE